MWRDLARVCEAERLSLKLPPAKFPQNGLKAARLALAVCGKAGRRPLPAPCSPQTTPSRKTSARRRRCAHSFCDAEAALAAANTPENKDALRRQTEEAASRGLFGAPSFTIGDELFWCNDRLESALAWAKHA